MKLTSIISSLAALSGLAVSTPVDISLASNAPSLTSRSTGTLKAWTSASSACSGTAGYTWTDIGSGCITFQSGDGSAKIVQRLNWSGQPCNIYGYSATGCSSGQRTLSAYSSNICIAGGLFLSFQVVC